MKKTKNYILVTLALLLVACGEGNFKVTGKIEGASDSTKMVMEVSNNGLWLIADSVTPDKNGEFKVSLPAPQYADIYRLRYNDKAIYFPIDSIDNVVINGKLEAFATDYTLGGTAQAEAVMNLDKKAMQMHDATEEELREWKHELANQILTDPSGIVAYYIINKYIDGKPLFNPTNKEDLKIIGAVANAYNSFKPNDPRTSYLVALTVNNRRWQESVNAKADTVVVDEVPLIDIVLQDEAGKEQKLSEISGQDKVVLLNFTVYGDELSPAFNKVLADEYKKYNKRGLEIYQIAYDSDEFQWRQAAKNLPWVTVYDSNGVQSKNLAMYNVGGFPTVFIINRKGEIVERVTELNDLSSKIAKYL